MSASHTLTSALGLVVALVMGPVLVAPSDGPVAGFIGAAMLGGAGVPVAVCVSVC